MTAEKKTVYIIMMQNHHKLFVFICLLLIPFLAVSVKFNIVHSDPMTPAILGVIGILFVVHMVMKYYRWLMSSMCFHLMASSSYCFLGEIEDDPLPRIC
ncbi:MAG: hypothetical protein DRQ44_10570 [Gammaproteobacteria bacterium]|nr:MAG: hypothetical protein DRQ44_10570 [Gammaproteobacteria bacterium]